MMPLAEKFYREFAETPEAVEALHKNGAIELKKALDNAGIEGKRKNDGLIVYSFPDGSAITTS